MKSLGRAIYLQGRWQQEPGLVITKRIFLQRIAEEEGDPTIYNDQGVPYAEIAPWATGTRRRTGDDQ